jgi:ankyrin repeat protein|tara:strand:+ start:643 stop:993 length:351 start_codon:yes stop_codon:yes gene_type:complete
MSFTIHQKLIFAARGRNLRLVEERIAEGADIDYQDPQHGSALIAAINNNDVRLIQFLIEKGINVNLQVNRGVVPLEVALHHASDDVVRLLAWSGAKLSSRARSHWKERLRQCLANS